MTGAMLTALAACLLLHNPTVIDPATASVRVEDVVIRDGRISGGSCANSVDLSGRYLIPGLVDMHAHLLLHPWDEGGHIRPHYDRPSVEQMLRTFLAFGVTTIRDPGDETEAAVMFRHAVSEGTLRGPTIETAGRILTPSRMDIEPFVCVTTAAEVRREIRWQAGAGVDFIKIYAAMPPDLVRVAIEEAHAHHIPVIGHLQATSWTEAAGMGIDGVEHAAPWSAELLRRDKRAAYHGGLFDRVFWLQNTDPRAIDAMIAALVKHHVVVDPTLIAMHTKFFGNDSRWRENPDNALAPPLYVAGWPAGSFTRGWSEEEYAAAQRAWPQVEGLIRRMFEAGVVMTVGTDTPTPWIVPGASVHDEMVLLHDAGIPIMDVLKMATANAAAALRRGDIGAIRPGMRADLIVLKKNPLEDIHNTRSIETVYKGGVAIR